MGGAVSVPLERLAGPPAAIWRGRDVVGPTALRHPSRTK